MAGAADGAGKLRALARWLMAERESGRPMSELRDMARFVAEGHRAELAVRFYADHYAPVRGIIAAAVESGEFRGDADFLTWPSSASPPGCSRCRVRPIAPPRPAALPRPPVSPSMAPQRRTVW
jgi:hypothetical protein